MKGQWKWKNNKRKKDTGKLKKFMVSVDEFVQRKRGCGDDDVEDDHGLRFVKTKSRKELRKQKRKLKKAKMKRHYEGKNQPDLRPDDSGTQDAKQQLQVKQKAKKEKSKTPQTESTIPTTEKAAKKQSATKEGKKSSKLLESRKKALLEANEAEDREIKKLERSLGFNKRKNKKNLPQCFVADGLDYILGALGSGSSAVATYDSDDDMDVARENFEKLDDSDSEMSGAEEEPGNESVNDSKEELDADDGENGEDDDKDEEEEDDDDGMDDEEEEEDLGGGDGTESTRGSDGEAEETVSPDS